VSLITSIACFTRDNRGLQEHILCGLISVGKCKDELDGANSVTIFYTFSLYLSITLWNLFRCIYYGDWWLWRSEGIFPWHGTPSACGIYYSWYDETYNTYCINIAKKITCGAKRHRKCIIHILYTINYIRRYTLVITSCIYSSTAVYTTNEHTHQCEERRV